MSDVDRVVDQCEQTWRRLRVRTSDRAAMADELRSDLQHVAEAGVGPAEFLGGDSDTFARTWASERGVVRPRFRLASTTIVAAAAMLPGAGFAAVLPLLSTSEWGLTALVKAFPSQRAKTNLDCLLGPTTVGGCSSPSWDTPAWLIAGWYATGVAIAFFGALAGSSAWLRRCGDPLRPTTLRWIAAALPTVGLTVGAMLAVLDKSDLRPGVGDGIWAPILAFSAVGAVFLARTAAVLRARHGVGDHPLTHVP